MRERRKWERIEMERGDNAQGLFVLLTQSDETRVRREKRVGKDEE